MIRITLDISSDGQFNDVRCTGRLMNINQAEVYIAGQLRACIQRKLLSLAKKAGNGVFASGPPPITEPIIKNFKTKRRQRN